MSGVTGPSSRPRTTQAQETQAPATVQQPTTETGAADAARGATQTDSYAAGGTAAPVDTMPVSVPADAPKLDRAALTAQLASAPLQAFASTGRAERESGPIAPTQKMDLADQDARVALLRNSGQVNAVSRKAGDDGLICGGASTAAALVMTSKTPEQGKANAAAVEKVAGNLDVKISADEQKALDSMKAGKMSPNDVSNLQQLMYRCGKKAGAPEGGAADGMGPKQMFGLAGMLKAEGGFPGSNVTFSQNQTKLGDSTALHWTVSVDNLHYNPINPSNDKKALVMGGGTPSDLADRNGQLDGKRRWSATVNVNDEKVTSEFASGTERGQFHRQSIDVDKLQRAPNEVGPDGVPSKRLLMIDWQRTIERKGRDPASYPIE